MDECIIYNQEDILEITQEVVDDLKERALRSPRKRSRLCMHHSLDHVTHEMLIVFHKATFMPPHRHPKGKSESYHIVEGSMIVYFFDDNGNITRSINMKKAGGKGVFLYRLSNNEWHMPVPTSEWLVYHETYSGPFNKDFDVEFPEWAPLETDRQEISKFLKFIKAT